MEYWPTRFTSGQCRFPAKMPSTAKRRQAGSGQLVTVAGLIPRMTPVSAMLQVLAVSKTRWLGFFISQTMPKNDSKLKA
jgi:hypothetical protein